MTGSGAGKGFEYNIRKNFLITAIIPLAVLLALFILFIGFFNEISIRGRTERAAENVRQKIQQMDHFYRSVCEKQAQDEGLKGFLRSGAGSNRVFEDYYRIINQSESKFQICVLDSEQNVILKSGSKDNFEVNYSFLPLFRIASEEDNKVVRIYYQENHDTVAQTGYYGYGTVIYEEGELLGYLVYYADNKELRELLLKQGAEEVVVTNQFDTVLVTTSENARTSLNKLAYKANSHGQVSIQGDLFQMGCKSMEQEGLNIYALNQKGYEGYIGTLICFSLLVLILITVLLLKLSRTMSRKVTEPIGAMLDAIRETSDGKFDISLELGTGDEFDTLAKEYSSMVKKVDALIESNKNMAELQRQAEFKMIRNQFNPHFIFNVLETLRYTVFVSPVEAEKMILSLSKFLRYNLYNQDKFVPLKEDIEHLEDYLMLHKARFQERLTYEISVEEEAGQIFVPKFFSQPLAENSVKYGFQHRDQFHIAVHAAIVEDRLIMKIEDNGGGMTEERYLQVMEHLASREYPDDHVGLYNVNRTLQLTYGEKYGIRLENRSGDSLTVFIEIPAQKS